MHKACVTSWLEFHHHKNTGGKGKLHLLAGLDDVWLVAAPALKILGGVHLAEVERPGGAPSGGLALGSALFWVFRNANVRTIPIIHYMFTGITIMCLTG